MEAYSGFNIPERIIIVSKDVVEYNQDQGDWVPTGEKRGYVVIPGNKNTLDSALSWAGVQYDYAAGTYINYDKYVHEYENGKFLLKIVDSAYNSSQGGKLSFWTCEIAVGSDKYLIGINADLLCDFIINNNLSNGCCENVYLGRQKARVGAFTENMKSFNKAKLDAKIRAMKPSTKYEPGQIVFNRNGDYYVYLGEMFQTYDIAISRKVFGFGNKYDVVIYTKPKKVYAYGALKSIYNRHGKAGIDFSEITWVSMEDKKQSFCFEPTENAEVTFSYDEYLATIHNNELKWTAKYAAENNEKKIIEEDARYNYEKLKYNTTAETLTLTTEIRKIINDYLHIYYNRFNNYDISDYKFLNEYGIEINQ